MILLPLQLQYDCPLFAETISKSFGVSWNIDFCGVHTCFDLLKDPQKKTTYLIILSFSIHSGCPIGKIQQKISKSKIIPQFPMNVHVSQMYNGFHGYFPYKKCTHLREMLIWVRCPVSHPTCFTKLSRFDQDEASEMGITCKLHVYIYIYTYITMLHIYIHTYIPYHTYHNTYHTIPYHTITLHYITLHTYITYITYITIYIYISCVWNHI